jgi:CsoR family transcriptional regulator, copper-sensing transcriptional repressor
MHGYTPDQASYLRRLRRIEGQVRGALGLLEDHLSHCVTEAVAEGGDGAADKIREASDSREGSQ